MKKALALLLSVVLVISSVTCALVFPAAAATGENLWTDPTVGFTSTSSNCKMTYVAKEEPYVSSPSYKVDAPYWSSFSLQLPSNLSADKLYRLSFEYMSLPNNANALSDYYISSMYLSKDGTAYGDKYMPSKTMMQSTMSNKIWNTVEQEFFGADGEFRWQVNSLGTVWRMYFRNISLVEVPVYTVDVEGGTADASKAKVGSTVTLSFDAANNTKLFKEWQVVSGDVTLADATAETTTFTMPEEDVEIKAIYEINCWPSITTADIVNCAGATLTYPRLRKDFDTAARMAVLQDVHYQSFYIKMPALKANTMYRLSMGYSYSASDGKLTGMRVLNQTQMDAMLADSNKNFPTEYTAIMFGSGTSSEVTTKEFVTDDSTAYYLAVRSTVNGTDSNADLSLVNLSLVEVAAHTISVTGGTASASKAGAGTTVTITADSVAGKVFAGWQIVSGNIVLADATSATTTFTMPEEPVEVKAIFKENLWSESKQFSVLTDYWTTSITESNGVVTFNSPQYYQKFYFTLPELEKNATYRIALNATLYNQDLSQVALESAAIATGAQVATAAQWGSWSGNGISILPQATISGNNYSYAIDSEFQTGDQTQYYIGFSTKHVTSIKMTDFVLTKVASAVLPEYSSEAARVEAVEGYSLETAAIGSELKFTVVKDDGVTVTVTYAGDTVTPDQNGVYTVLVQEDATLGVTTSGQSAAQTHAPGVGLKGEDLTQYDSDVYSNPVWTGDTVYQEAVMFYNTTDGYVKTEKSLLYPIDDVISVRSYDLKTWYVKGVDFDINAAGQLVWLESGKLPIYTGAFTTAQVEGEASAYYTTDAANGLLLMNDKTHEEHTVYVTYQHTDTWGAKGYSGETPDNQGYDMGRFYEKLAANEEIDVLVYGDSVGTGCSSTGADMNYDRFALDGTFIPRATYGWGIQAPTFFEQATAALIQKANSQSAVNYYNLAYGGKDSSWGKASLADRVGYMNAHYGEGVVNPDLIYVIFAGNDAWNTAANYKANMQSIVSQLKEFYPNANIILVSGKVNNQRTWLYDLDNTGIYRPSTHASTQNNSRAQEQALVEIADANANCIVAKATSVWEDIVTSKDEEDYLSNNINHANDFWAMVTAQIIVAAAEEKADAAAGLSTAYDSKAAIRAEGSTDGTIDKNGLRIYNEVKTEWLNNSEITEFGSIAIRKNYLNALYNKGKISSTALTLENLASYIGKGVGVGVSYSKGQDISTLWKTTDGTMVFTSYLTGIEATNFDEDYWIVAYAKDENGKTYYSDIAEVCVYEVAEAIDAAATAGEDVPEIDQKAFNTFVTANLEEYKAWYKALYGEEPTRTEFDITE